MSTRRARSSNTTTATAADALLAGFRETHDRARQAQAHERAQELREENAALRSELAATRRELDAVAALQRDAVETFTIKPSAKRASEAVAWALASDWHVEERVDPRIVNGLNEYDLRISRERATRYFQNVLRLVTICRRDVEIPTVVLALLGDFFTNSIHEDCAESNLLSPIDAAMLAEDYLASGIAFLLRETRQLGTTFIVPCHSGNHGRTTREQRVSTEAGNSLEFFMYHHLARQFAHEPRVTFQIARGYHSFVESFGVTVRAHHGHAIRYAGGVGGLMIPTMKKIAQWQRSRHADLDVFGHVHHLMLDPGPFVSNGSLIGHSAFAIKIGAAFEQPAQAFFLVDKKRGVTGRWPIHVARDV